MIYRLQTSLGHFQWENGHNSLQQSWITIKNATFDISKKFLGPVHLHPKTDKWDYLRSPIMKKKIVSCFDIGAVPRSPGKRNWNWLYFLSFIFTFEQGEQLENSNSHKYDVGTAYLQNELQVSVLRKTMRFLSSTLVFHVLKTAIVTNITLEQIL